MLPNQLINFYNNWNRKSNRIRLDTLDGLFDKYITLFVIYNFLYNQIPQSHAFFGNNKLPGDKYKATTGVRIYLGSKQIWNILHEDCALDITGIKTLIEGGTFNIRHTNGSFNRRNDRDILTDLISADYDKQVQALLEVCYYVRSNIFHGNKDFEANQELLLRPLISILSSITRILYKKLSR